MIKVEIFKHRSACTLTEKINKFIEEQNLVPKNIHDIKLSSGPEDTIVAMIVYMNDDKDYSSNFNDKE
jgi:hypothetical protein